MPSVFVMRAVTPTTTFADNFNRANSTTGLGSPWIAMGSGSLGITSNTAYVASSPSGNSWAYVDIGSSNFDMTVTWAGTPDDYTHLLYRMTGASTSTAPYINRGEIFLNGSGPYGFGTTFASGDVMRVTGVGTQIKVYKNGALVYSGVDTRTGTQFGFGGNAGSTGRFDNFSITY